MSTITPIAQAQQRQQDRQMLECVLWQIETNHETERRLQEMRRQLEGKLGLNKPDGPEVA